MNVSHSKKTMKRNFYTVINFFQGCFNIAAYAYFNRNGT